MSAAETMGLKFDGLAGKVPALATSLLDAGSKGKGAAGVFQELANQAVGGHWDELKGQLHGVADQINGVIPAGQQMLGWMKTAGEYGKNLSGPLQGVGQVLGKLGTSAEGLMGPFTSVLGQLSGWVTGAAEAGTAGEALAVVVEALTGPIGWVVAAVGVLAAAWYNDWGGIREHTQKFIAWVKPYLGEAWEKIQVVATKVWGEVSKFIQEIWPPIQKRVTEVTAAVTGVIQGLLDWIKPIWTDVWGNVKGYFEGVWKAFEGIVKIAWGTLTAVVSGLIMAFTGDWKGAWEAVKNHLKLAWDGVKELVTGGLQAVVNLITGFGKALFDAGGKLVHALWDGIKAAWGWLKDQFKGALNLLDNLLPHSDAKEGPLSQLTKSGKSILLTLAKGILSGKGDLKKAMTEALKGATEGQDVPSLGGETSKAARPGGKWADMAKQAGMNGTLQGVAGLLSPGGFSFGGLGALMGANPFIGAGMQLLDMLGVGNLFSKGIGGLFKGIGKIFRFDSEVNDRNARRWGFDFGDHFLRGVETYAGRYRPSMAAAGAGGGATHVVVNMGGQTVSSNMDVQQIGDSLAWHIIEQLRSTPGR
jgi:phage-related protein